jgi:hypothetical protein
MDTITPILLPHRFTAGIFGAVALLLLVAAAVAAAIGSEVVAMVAASLSVVPALVALLIWSFAGRHERMAAALLADRKAIGWAYTPDDWQRHVGTERHRGRHLGLVVGGIFGLAGLGVALAMVDDGAAIAGSELLTLVLPVAAGFGLGLLIGAVVQRCRGFLFDRVARAEGCFRFGTGGLYLTGTYWPLRGFGVSLESIELEGSDLLFRFSQHRGGIQTVRVPVPAGREAEARSIAGT